MQGMPGQMPGAPGMMGMQPIHGMMGQGKGAPMWTKPPEEKDPLAALTATIGEHVETKPGEKKKRKKAVLKTAATLANITTTIQTLTRNGLAPKPVNRAKYQPTKAVEILYEHWKVAQLRKGGPAPKKKAGPVVVQSTPPLDSEEWVTMLDNAIAENENQNNQNREDLLKDDDEVVEEEKINTAISEGMDVFDSDIRDAKVDPVDPYLYQLRFGPEAVAPLGLQMDWTSYPPKVAAKLKHTPAAGPQGAMIKVGDQLVVINGTPIAKIPTHEFAAYMKPRPLILVFRSIAPVPSNAPGSRPTPPSFQFYDGVDENDYLRTKTNRLEWEEVALADRLQPQYQLTDNLTALQTRMPAGHRVQPTLEALFNKAREAITVHDGLEGVPPLPGEETSIV